MQAINRYNEGKEAEMATSNQSSDSTTDNTETASQDNTTGTEATGETSAPASSSTEGQQATGSEQPVATTNEDQPAKDPNKEALLADLTKERKQRQTLQAQVEQLQATADSGKQHKDELTAVQRKYNRLESFLTEIGGPLSKALDSKSFTEKLFGTDSDVKALVADWHKANPSATSTALSSGSAQPANKASGMNDLLRAAAK